MGNSQNYNKTTLLGSIFSFQKRKFNLYPMSFFPNLIKGFTTSADGYKYAFNLTNLQGIISGFAGENLVFTWNGTNNVGVSDGYSSQTLVVYAGSTPVTS